jgi:hypothetical protein
VSRKAFLMRIDPALRAELERAAAADLRSVNGEIEFLLRAALRRRGRALPGDLMPSDRSTPDEGSSSDNSD